MIQEGKSRACNFVSSEGRSGGCWIAHIIESEVATGCAKTEAKDD